MRKILVVVFGFLVAAVCVFPASAQGIPVDVSESRNRGAIEFLYQQGVISGYPDGSFRPEASINRAELLKILVGTRTLSPDPNFYHDCFLDVKNEWFARYVCYARAQGWVQGYPDGSFRPGQFVNKAEAIKMIVNVRGYFLNNMAVSSPNVFVDVPLAEWYAPYVITAFYQGLLEESGGFLQPAAAMTRGEVSESVFRSITFQRASGEFSNVAIGNPYGPQGYSPAPAFTPGVPVSDGGGGGGVSAPSAPVDSSNSGGNGSGSSNSSPVPSPSPSPSPNPSPNPSPAPNPTPMLTSFEPRGVGGGGAMAGYSVDPWNSALRFVGTDMGTLFRSTDSGKTWRPVDDSQARFYADLKYAAPAGFNPDRNIVFFASGGKFPQRSSDAGVTFQPITMPLQTDEHIQYFESNSQDGAVVFAATDQGLLRSADHGRTWTRLSGISGEAKGTVILDKTVYHATSQRVFRSQDGGVSFSSFYVPDKLPIRSFSGGSRGNTTLALIDSDDAAAPLVGAQGGGTGSVGYVWVYRADTGWKKTLQPGGDFVAMAENDEKTIYVTGSANWPDAYGTKVWISRDAGATWTLKLHQYNWDINPFQPWPQMELSAVGMDVGWWDSGYYTFFVDQLNSSIAGGSQNFFLFSTENYGDYWDAPFGDYAGTGTPIQAGNWKTQGLEVTSVRHIQFSPSNPNVMYAGSMDVGGYFSEDHGQSWRISRPQGINAVYDFAFDPANSGVLYAAAGAEHDWPFSGHEGTRNTTEGGIYMTSDTGKTWKQLTPSIGQDSRLGVQYLSVAYDSAHKVLYAGRQGFGVVRSLDNGKTWQEINDGLPGTDNLIVPQIEIDPVNQDIYILASGDFPSFTNQKSTGIYVAKFDASKKPTWKLLRGNITTPGDDWPDDGLDGARTLDATASDKPWWYPVSFAVDWNDASRKTLYLGDKEVNAAYLWSGIWKTVDGGNTWKRLKYWQNVVGIFVDAQGRIYVAADDWDDQDISVKKKWGLWYSDDGGATWKLMPQLPLKHNVYGVTSDPSDPGKIWVSFFGGGMMAGPRP